MEEVSIIINGVRYDATLRQTRKGCNEECDLTEWCNEREAQSDLDNFSDACEAFIGRERVFKLNKS